MGNSCVDSIFAMLQVEVDLQYFNGKYYTILYLTTGYGAVADSADEDMLTIALVGEGAATVTLLK